MPGGSGAPGGSRTKRDGPLATVSNREPPCGGAAPRDPTAPFGAAREEGGSCAVIVVAGEGGAVADRRPRARDRPIGRRAEGLRALGAGALLGVAGGAAEWSRTRILCCSVPSSPCRRAGGDGRCGCGRSALPLGGAAGSGLSRGAGGACRAAGPFRGPAGSSTGDSAPIRKRSRGYSGKIAAISGPTSFASTVRGTGSTSTLKSLLLILAW